MNAAKLATALRSPTSVGWYLLKRYNQHRAVRVMAEDWDTLVVLDGCREDLFRATNDIEGTYRSTRSAGTHTGEFLRANFAGRSVPDTVYVTANPQVRNHGVESNFAACRHVWDSDWDDELGTVPPEAVTRAVRHTREEFPDKRLIAHYVQPHYPFIGETGRAIEHGSITGDGLVADDRDHPSIWDRLEAGTVSRSLVWRAYRENLELVLESVSDLLADLPGKTVITSDHGNAIGEWGLYGHPGERHVDVLSRVPWLEIESGARTEISADATAEPAATADGSIEDRLEALGYVDE